MFFTSALSGLTVECGVDKITSDEFTELYSTEAPYWSMQKMLERVPREVAMNYPRHHDSWYTEEKLIRLLKNAGFSKAYPSRYGQSKTVNMRDTEKFDYMHPQISLYI
jgi:hypothetical protein